MSACIFFASDAPLPEVFPPPEYEYLAINVDDGTIDDGGADDRHVCCRRQLYLHRYGLGSQRRHEPVRREGNGRAGLSLRPYLTILLHRHRGSVIPNKEEAGNTPGAYYEEKRFLF